MMKVNLHKFLKYKALCMCNDVSLTKKMMIIDDLDRGGLVCMFKSDFH